MPGKGLKQMKGSTSTSLPPLGLLSPFLLTALLLFPAPRVSAAEKLTINCDDGPPYSTPDQKGLSDLRVREAFRRAGLEIEIARVPSERALLNVDQGIDDGTYDRIAGVESAYPSLVMVPEPVTEFEFVAFSRRLDIRIADWSSLKPYSVGIVTGWKLLEANIREVRELLKVRDERQLFNLLDKNRADLVVIERRQGLEACRQNAGGVPHVLDPPLAVRKMYLYLNRKHAGLVQRLADALRGMNADGTSARIEREVMERYPAAGKPRKQDVTP
jgi:polar amino acid transport system substrate-binding protein